MLKAPKKAAPLWNWGALVGAVITVIIARLLAIGTLNDEPLGGYVINASYDIPFGFRKPIPAREAVIVYMDEQSHRELKQSPHRPWSRPLHAQLIRKLTAEKAKVIVLDALFFEESAGDAEMTAAIKAHGKVVVGALGEFEIIKNDLGTKRAQILDSSVFRDVASQGLVNLDPDRASFVRRVFHVPPWAEVEFPTLAEKAADVAGYAVSEDSRKTEWLNFYGPPGHLPSASYYRVLANEGTTPGFFQDKTVFVGQRTAAGYSFDEREDFGTPYSVWGAETMSGVEVHVNRFLNLIHNNGLRRVSPFVEALLYGFFGIALGWGLTLVRPLFAAFIAVITAILIAWVSFLFFKANLWWPWMIAAGVQVPVALSWAVIFNTVRLRIESKTLERSLALHLSDKRAKQVLKRPELLQVGGERQDVSILFSDIANFSTITARMHPDDLFKMLNDYFEITLGCVHAADGTVVKLIGDAIFAIWNAPFPQENHAKLAVTAALNMRDALVKFDSGQSKLPLNTRIGLHMGNACVGNVGSKQRFDYTAIGDSINMSARLEGLNKYLDTQVLGTRDIQILVEKDFSSRMVGYFVFKGLDKAVEIHEFIGKPGEGAEWVRSFNDALSSFYRKDFERASAGFKATIQAHGGKDGPSEFYLEEIDKLAKTELPANWAGEIRLSEK